MSDAGEADRVVIIGGGLAGLATAAALADEGVDVELFEARRRLGGRASSWHDAASGASIDFCQHVGMACCTNFADFCRRTGVADRFRRADVLHFFGPDGRRCDFRATRGLPAPLHLLPSFARLGYLSLGERARIGTALRQLARLPAEQDDATIGDWLRAHGQSSRAVELFWAPVLVSALGEAVDKASLKYARKVFVDGFLRNAQSYQVDVPTAPLHELFDGVVAAQLRRRGATLQTGLPIRALRRSESSAAWELDLGDDVVRTASQVVVALAWRRAAELLAPLRYEWPAISSWSSISGAPISGVHLWFDRPLTDLPHAVLVGTLAQWLFRRDSDTAAAAGGEHYYQVVVSASYDLEALDREVAIAQIVAELKQAFPAAAEARLLRHRVVTEREAVFSARPGIDALRPPQTTPLEGLFLAGDWTATGWPGTMESAVRSGYLAAEGVLTKLGRPRKLIVDDLPLAKLSQRLFRL